jgi:hypothetical protein
MVLALKFSNDFYFATKNYGMCLIHNPNAQFLYNQRHIGMHGPPMCLRLCKNHFPKMIALIACDEFSLWLNCLLTVAEFYILLLHSCALVHWGRILIL